MKKVRLDRLLTNLGFFDSGEKAKRAVMAGLVTIDGKPRTKPGEQIPEDIAPGSIVVKGDPVPFVSRGGLKLDKALKVFDFPVAGLSFFDIGASTGGFTDCLLQNGAARVASIDVGYGQLAYTLRGDARVVNMERTNFRHLNPEDVPFIADATVMDVSFISILKLLDHIRAYTGPKARGAWLIKPQFEAGKGLVGKNGVIRDEKIHASVVTQTVRGIEAAGFSIKGMDYSPIRGPKGNIEFLVMTQKEEKDQTPSPFSDEAIKNTVAKAHRAFEKGDKS